MVSFVPITGVQHEADGLTDTDSEMETLMARQGRLFDEAAVQRIISLLANTDMTVTEIAQRMSCSRSAILSINRKRQIRHYDGLHSTWRICETSLARKPEMEVADARLQDDLN